MISAVINKKDDSKIRPGVPGTGIWNIGSP